jgi:hypothetical protein
MRALFIIGILFAGLTVYSQDICLTPKEYRFYAGAVIDAQVLKKDTVRLNFAVKKLVKAHVEDSLVIVKLEDVGVKYGEKEAVYIQDLNLCKDDVDKYKGKTVRNRRIAIAGFGTVTLEALIIAGFIYLR